MRLHWTWEKTASTEKSSYSAPASATSGKCFSSQIINDTLPARNYAQTQGRQSQNIHTSMTKRIHAADGICRTCDVVDSSQRVKIHGEEGGDVGARVSAKRLLLRNMSRLLWKRRVIALYATLAAARRRGA